jgi:malonyl-CoA/methylmalonyl-CoA synthetase
VNTELEIIVRARRYSGAVALQSGENHYNYNDLLGRSARLAAALLKERSCEDLKEQRVAFLAPAGVDYVSIQWAIWRAGGIAVPLSLSATSDELGYVLDDAEVSLVVGALGQKAELPALCRDRGLRLIHVAEVDDPVVISLPEVPSHRQAMILYTSGTTSKPKGVVTTHENIQAQIETLVEAWEWSESDRIPLFLPLHHVHGIINILCCALWSGARVETFPRFDTDQILNRVADGAYSMFMGVPTIYVKLLDVLPEHEDAFRRQVTDGFKAMRLMVSGSAALPATVHKAWETATGQSLLERYGMTEIGMALSNPFRGERRPGSVGQPLPSVEIRLINETGKVVKKDSEPGEIQVRGPAVFPSYWKRAEATAESFTGSWFKTGDIAVKEEGYYRIMGRQSVDIIKSGGYKLSALEIEAKLLDHPAIRECAVVGLPDDTWGEAVAAALVLTENEFMDLASLREWCKSHLSAYKIPRQLLQVNELPRNAMGKVTKPAVLTLFEPAPDQSEVSMPT